MATASSSTCASRRARCSRSAKARCTRRSSGCCVNGWASAEWGTSDNNRRARYYTLTAAGRRQLAAERAEFERMVGGIQGVLGTA